MDTAFMNSGNSKIPDSHRLILNLSDKINFEYVKRYMRKNKYVASSNLSIYYTWKNIKK